MSQTTAKINASLVDIKTLNHSLSRRLHQTGFNTEQTLGAEHEYTVKTLLNDIDSLAVQFLTITANREQFIQRTRHSERMEMQTILRSLLICLKQTSNTLDLINNKQLKLCAEHTLCYITEQGERESLILVKAVDYLDAIKPHARLLELVIAQQRIHALSAVLETLLQHEQSAAPVYADDEEELTGEQIRALELSRYLIKQAL